ncbi:carbohydrate ABC transporter permease [Paenibacillus sp. J2TS4]|uniref:carbohydrate ABC transporter permease n=1 Tax=Paenibacillus sp. J2TS4 TaxID=2807194 RepID=UPI001B172005|nr:sugar ABC transporter permease [Paenibacillus sp. J2TS4]GIP30953.1 sugar ABC transporter [Paenibacillus sp. J2TS4]
MKTDALTGRARKTKLDLMPYLLVAPAILLIFLCLIFPIFSAVKISLTDATLLKYDHAKWIGADNYSNFLKSGTFLKVITATLIYVIGSVVLTYSFGLIAALLMEHTERYKFLFRSLVILPWAVPQVVLVLLWKWMINPQYGVITYLTDVLGLLPSHFSWLSDHRFAMVAILMTTVWKQYPLSFLMLMAGMKGIPKELYEAASIDGASALRKFAHITMPGLKYVTSGLILLLTIWSFGNFVIVWLMTQGGPSDSTAVLTIYTYLNAFTFNNLGYGAAIGVVCLLLSLVFSVLYYYIFIKKMGTE